MHTESSAMGGMAKELDVAASEGVVETAQVLKASYTSSLTLALSTFLKPAFKPHF